MTKVLKKVYLPTFLIDPVQTHVLSIPSIELVHVST